MGNVKIKYLGFGIQNLDTTNIEDAIWHLGAKYGAIVYNAGIQVGAIKVNTETNQIEVDVAEMNLLNGK
jgi:hypothetical protein